MLKVLLEHHLLHCIPRTKVAGWSVSSAIVEEIPKIAVSSILIAQISGLHLPKQLLENKKKAGGSDKLEISGVSIADNESSGPDLCRRFLDRGASAHCFQSSVQFVPGSLTSCAPRVIALGDEEYCCCKSGWRRLTEFRECQLASDRCTACCRDEIQCCVLRSTCGQRHRVSILK